MVVVKTLKLRCKLKVVGLWLIKFDKNYQRPLNAASVSGLANFLAAGGWVPAVHVNERDDGSMYCFDGQHRVQAAMKVGYERMQVNFYRGMSSREEAAAFSRMNAARLVQGWAKFQSALAAGFATEVRVQFLCDEVGLITGNKANGRLRKDCDLRTPRVLVRLYETYGESVFVMMLVVLTACFRGCGQPGLSRLSVTAGRTEYLRALARFLSEHGVSLTLPVIVQVLRGKENSADAMYQQATALANRDQRQRTVDRYIYCALCHAFGLGPGEYKSPRA